MRERLGELVAMLRRAGAPVSVGEVMDAHEAVAVVGLEREAMKEALATTLVKDHVHRDAFERAFLACFPGAPAARGEREGARRGAGAGESGDGEGAGKRRPPREPEGASRAGAPESRDERARAAPPVPPRSPRESPPRAPGETTLPSPRETTPRTPRASGSAEPAAPADSAPSANSSQRMARRAALLRQPFRTMPPDAIGEVRDLARELAQRLRRRWSRRWRASRRGRIDLRRTVRRAASRGGIPLGLLRRRPRPSRPDLVALLDLSWSTRLASELMLALLAPCERYFRRVALHGFVADVVPISLEGGHVVPHAPLEFDAPSDTGRALARFGAGAPRLRQHAVLLVLGDGRNNRKPARAEELATLRRRAGLVAWLVPEPPERWGTGDSAMPAYARQADVTLPVPDLASLAAALARLPGRIARGRRAIHATRAP